MFLTHSQLGERSRAQMAEVGGDVTEHSQASRSALFNALVEAHGAAENAMVRLGPSGDAAAGGGCDC